MGLRNGIDGQGLCRYRYVGYLKGINYSGTLRAILEMTCSGHRAMRFEQGSKSYNFASPDRDRRTYLDKFVEDIFIEFMCGLANTN